MQGLTMPTQTEYTDKDGRTIYAYPVVLVSDETAVSVEGDSITQFIDPESGRIINATPLIIMEDRRPPSGGGSGVAATNLAVTRTPTTATVTSDTGQDATIQAADSTNAGLLLPAEKTKLAGIAAGATANQPDATVNQAIALKADATAVSAINTALGQKADAVAVNTALGLKADASALLLKADATAVATALSAKADASAMTTLLAGKQSTLVSGNNLATINGASLLAGGNIVIAGGTIASDAQADAETNDTAAMSAIKTARMIRRSLGSKRRTISSYLRSVALLTVDETGATNYAAYTQAAIDYTRSRGETLLIDIPYMHGMYKDTTKIVFLDHGQSIECVDGGRLIINNSFCKGIVSIMSKDVLLKNMSIEWVGNAVASFREEANWASLTNFDFINTPWNNNSGIVQAWYASNRGITFNGTVPTLGNQQGGAAGIMPILSFTGDCDGTEIDRIKLYVRKEATAAEFLPVGLQFFKDYPVGTAVGGGVTYENTAELARGLKIKDWVTDGAWFASNGSLQDTEITGQRLYRYATMEGAGGAYPAGLGIINSQPNATSFPPPHAIYATNSKNLTIIDFIDFGIDSGTPDARRYSGGAMQSLKIGGDNITIKGAYSSRPDGVLDLYPISNSRLTGIVGISNSSIYDGGDVSFPPFRLANIPGFPVQITKSHIEAVLEDMNPNTVGVPMAGNMTSVSSQLDLTMRVPSIVTQSAPTTINYVQLFLNGIDSHSNTRLSIGENSRMVFPAYVVKDIADTTLNCTADISIVGWRDSYSDMRMIGGKVPMVRDNSSNVINPNSFRVHDISNAYRVDSSNGLYRATKIVKGIFVPDAIGGTFTTTSHIPDGWRIKSGFGKVIAAFGTTGGLTAIQVGWSGATTNIGTISNLTNGILITRDQSEVSGDKIVLLTPIGGSFDGTGKIEIVLELEFVNIGWA